MNVTRFRFLGLALASALWSLPACTPDLQEAIRGAATDIAGRHGPGTTPPPVEQEIPEDPSHPLFVPPSIDPELAEHTKLFVPPKIYTIGDNVYSAVGYGLANIIMVTGADGVIIVDTGVSIEQAQAAWADLAPIANGRPVKGVIYTHHHADHVGGASFFVSLEDARNKVIPVVAQESLIAEYAQENVIIGEIMGVRAYSMYNTLLPPSQVQGMNSGIGPLLRPGTVGFVPPNTTFSNQLDLTIAGVQLHIIYVPSEAESELAIYLPTNNILLSAEVIQDDSFPNLYSLRGAKFRNPRDWYQSIDKLRAFKAGNMVLQHGPPVYGAAKVAEVLEQYRDGIQFVHDQSLRLMNKGFTAGELVEAIHLPPHLANIKPWLQPFYGSVEHSVPQIYNGYLGWFQGDPVALKPTPNIEKSRRLIGLMGGPSNVLGAARQAYDTKDYQWAAELATYLIDVNRLNQEARKIKAAAFKQLGYAQINANWRGLYLTASDVLDRTLVLPIALLRAGVTPFDGSALPLDWQLLAITSRLRAELTLQVTMRAGFRFTDTGEQATGVLRRGILEIDDGLTGGTNFTIQGPSANLGQVLDGTTPLFLALLTRQVTVTGSLIDAFRFFAYFELGPGLPPNPFVR